MVQEEKSEESKLRKRIRNGTLIGRYRFEITENIVGTEVWYVTDINTGAEHGPYRFLYEAQLELQFK